MSDSAGCPSAGCVTRLDVPRLDVFRLDVVRLDVWNSAQIVFKNTQIHKDSRQTQKGGEQTHYSLPNAMSKSKLITVVH